MDMLHTELYFVIIKNKDVCMYVCMYVCTAHLQRDAKHLARKSNDKEAKILYGKLSKLLHRARIWSVENIQKIT